MNDTLEKPRFMTTYQKDKIIHKLALEQTQRTIAQDHNITQPAVSDINRANKDKIAEVKQLLLLENLDDIRQSIRDDITNNKALSIEFKTSSNITSPKVAYKASVQKNIITPLLQEMDIFPGRTIHIGDNVNNQHNYVIPPVIQAFIDSQSDHRIDETQAVDTNGDTIDDDK